MMSSITAFATICFIYFKQVSFVESKSCSAAQYNGCSISENNHEDVGWIDGESSWYHCLNDWELYENLKDYEIRVIGAYESTDGHSGFRQHNSGPITINLQSCHSDNNYDFSKPTLLYLSSYEPVDWIITTSDSIVESNITLAEIYVSSYYAENSSVTVSNNLEIDSDDIKIRYSSDTGYGECDDTQTILEDMKSRFGNDVFSFIGAYEFDTVYACVGKQDQYINTTNRGM